MAKKMGRPSKFTDKLRDKILALAEKGKTIDEIAKAIKVSRATIYNWMGDKENFLDALKESKDVSDELVQVSLFRRACGYSAPAVKMFYDKDRGKVVVQKYIEHYPPDPTSMIFWLKNRQPEQWRDNPERNGDAVEMPSPVYVVASNKPNDPAT